MLTLRYSERQINVIRRINIEIKKEVVLKINSEVCVSTKLPYFIIPLLARYNPIYTFFIGTCAGLDSNKNIIGDVLIPQNIYNYESGKHKDDGTFESDHHCYSTDDDMRKYGEIVKNRVSNKFRIITDEHFCSGSAVVDYKSKKEEIKNGLPRKVNGLDMEAYSIACINYILREEGKKLSVVKAIMDFGENKEIGDKNMDKEIAMKNSAKATLEIIKYIHTEIING
jgi:nucleoside phosphorylase